MKAVIKRPNDHGQDRVECPNGHGPMVQISEDERVTFRGMELTVNTQGYKCSVCGIKTATIEQSAETQKTIGDTYKKKRGLITSDEMRECRNQLGITQQQLADKLNIGIASIKRWEGGLIQSKSMDRLLRKELNCVIDGEDPYTGNRELSLPRIKLVLMEFGKRLGRKLLKEGDKGLFAAKYVFYADMDAYRKLGASMTGARYALLPQGPQLDNYRDLIDEIIESDENETDPLENEEIDIIQKIAEKFPEKWDAFNASHREEVLKNIKIGGPIYYTYANNLTEI